MTASGMIDIDGESFEPEAARISVFDRGFLYGDSAFEAMRTYDRRPFRERDHLERLARSCERLRITLPIALPELARRIERTVTKSGLPECYIRVVVTRGSGPMGLDLTLAQAPSVVVYALPLRLPDPAIYRDGIAVRLMHTVRSTDGGPAAGAKTSNYLASMLVLDDAKRRGAQEAIIVDAQGHVVEGTTSNIFIVRADELYTPPIEAGILEGITRRSVIELAAARGLACHQLPLRAQDVSGAREVFITSSIREVVPVVRVDEIVIANGQPGPLTLAMLSSYREHTRALP